MDVLLIGLVQIILICCTAFFFYKEKNNSTGLHQTRLPLIPQNVLRFASLLEFISPQAILQNCLKISSSNAASSDIQNSEVSMSEFISRRLSSITELSETSELSADSGQSFDSSRKQEEYIIEFLDLLQSQTGSTLQLDRQLAVKMMEIALNTQTESQPVSTTRSTVSERLDEILDQLIEVNVRLTTLEKKFARLDRNNNELREND